MEPNPAPESFKQQLTSYKVSPIGGPIDFSVRPPGSKSLTNRALVCAALAHGRTDLEGVLESEDTRVMQECWRRLGVSIHAGREHQLSVAGCGGLLPNRKAELLVENSGTTIRFMTAVLGIAGGEYRLDGIPRMRQRPIGPLVQALRKLGVRIQALSPNECPPVDISSAQSAGGSTDVSGDLSSQYLSGLLLAGPLADQGLEVRVIGQLVSEPYIEMTIRVMRAFNVEVERCANGIFRIASGNSYRACQYKIEPDASAASYFWAAAAICGGQATVMGLNRQSLQGDIQFVEALKSMGCEVNYGQDSIAVTGPARRGTYIDMSDFSDTAQTLAVVAMFVEGETCIRGIAHNRLKETDRIGNLAQELRKLGGTVKEHQDGLTIVPGPLRHAQVETYDDHRMAMSFAIAGLQQDGIEILNPGCVAKTYPDFFEVLETINSASS